MGPHHPANDSGVSDPVSFTYVDDRYPEDFSRRVAARLERLEQGRARSRCPVENQDKPSRIPWHVFRRRRLALAVTVGIILCAGVLLPFIA